MVGALGLQALLAGSLGCGLPAADAAADDGTALPAVGAVAAAGRSLRAESVVDRRVGLLGKELDLDLRQRERVKALLERQRDQIDRVWNDESMPAAVKVGSTQAISEQTIEQIRSVLTEAQRKKYIQPRRGGAAVGTAGADVATWVAAGQHN
jgi:hypothetical protein